MSTKTKSITHGHINCSLLSFIECEIQFRIQLRIEVLEVNGVGYRAAKSGNKLTLNLGYSHPVEMEDPEGVETVVEGQNKIIVKGLSKEKVGQYAAEIRDKRRPEPYKGKGIKYADEVIRRKVGKTGAK